MDNSSQMICAYQIEFTGTRFYLLIMGSCVALLGILSNSLLVFVFATKALYEPTLALLGLCDTLLCACYIAIFGVEAAAYYFKIALLYFAWFAYIPVVFPLSMAVLMCIPALLILTLSQRCLQLSNKKTGCFGVCHKAISGGFFGLVIVCLACISRVPMYQAIIIENFSNCSDPFLRKQMWTEGGPIYLDYELFLTCVQAFVPFPILILLNAVLVYKHRNRRKRTQLSVELLLERSQPTAMHRPVVTSLYTVLSSTMLLELTDDTQNENNAIVTMVIIVSTYLICNSVHLVLTILEKHATHLVFEGESWTNFSHIAKDTVSFLFTLCSVIRLPIHYRFNPKVQLHLKRIFHQIAEHRERRSEGFVQENLRQQIATSMGCNTLGMAKPQTAKRKYGSIYA